MPFRTRNPYYLRISEKNVLPLYVYLDDRHLDWMSDRILQHVLEDLRPNILPKLKDQADAHYGPGGPPSAKKVTVDTHRGDTYQFCYFIRKTEPHSVLIKTRSFVAAPARKQPQMPPPPPPLASKPQRAKRKGRTPAEKPDHPSGNARKKRKTKGKGKAPIDIDSGEEVISSADDDLDDQNLDIQPSVSGPRRSGRTKKLVAGGYREEDDADTVATAQGDPDVVMTDQMETMPLANSPAAPPTTQDNGLGSILVKDEVDEITVPISSTEVTDVDAVMHGELPVEPWSAAEVELEIEEEENKPKPILQLKYQGFSIYGHCLCIVVEPWPSFRYSARAPSVAPTGARAASIAPVDFIPSGEASARLRARTPLFLPDDIDRERSETPAPFPRQRVLPQVPLYNDHRFDDEDNEDDYDGGGMMEFSQALNAAGDFRAGAADDNEDVDGAAFFGDADEAREL